jgi:hypothetical protein
MKNAILHDSDCVTNCAQGHLHATEILSQTSNIYNKFYTIILFQFYYVSFEITFYCTVQLTPRFQSQADVHFHFSLLLKFSSAILFNVQTDLSHPLEFMNGFRQGDTLACLFFNLALQKVIQDSCIQTRSTVTCLC